MQKRLKSQKKKSDKSTILVQSLSARVSPVGIINYFPAFAVDYSGTVKGLGNNLNTSNQKNQNEVTQGITVSGSGRTKLAKIKAKPNTERTIIKDEVKSNVPLDEMLYMNELKKKIKEIRHENNVYKKELKEDKSMKRLWTMMEDFKKRLEGKLLLLE